MDLTCLLQSTPSPTVRQVYNGDHHCQAVRRLATRTAKKVWGGRDREVILGSVRERRIARTASTLDGIERKAAIGDHGRLENRGSVFTVGHSNHSAEGFVGLLKEHGIEVAVDTRSRPYSRHAPHFNARAIEKALSCAGIGYLFLGGELGGRPEGGEFYDAEGRVDYALVERTRSFLDGISRLEKEVRDRRVALLCSEEDPTSCHRRLLVGLALEGRGITLLHIRGDGSVQTDDEATGRNPVLFPETEVSPRKSIRSVLRRRRRPSSSER